ncbi:uncharacterized protein BDW47DRAFT_106579 [Aspergillus candidus]|uniref:Uncharacterized protein n=1 Tax=Aspergillus candidus TaxID=41067 RepID=A0A2I2FAK7_ASPCN|nr:hypothetical protein BDW47DRAFT_106579 [Aspergillus candidus]PLB37661.1 hypothetical protein BDW47DRAFT_106579 [Aspergillus candidus]
MGLCIPRKIIVKAPLPFSIRFRKLSIAIPHIFLDWALDLRPGENGRRLPRIKRESSLETFWKVFRLVFERATSEKIESR